MADSVRYVVLFVTVPSEKEARLISEELIKNKLAACVNSLRVNSVFTWEGKIDQAEEILLIIKSRRSLFRKIEKLVKKHHSYEVPEIIALPILAGHRNYLDWISKSTV